MVAVILLSELLTKLWNWDFWPNDDDPPPPPPAFGG